VRLSARLRPSDGSEAVLALYDDKALDAEVAAAQRALEEALDADPLTQAAVRLRQAQGARQVAGILANSIRQRLGLEPGPVAGPGLVDVASAVRSYIERVGAERVADSEDEFHAAGEAAASE
jgi:hypothetical protein